MPTVRVRKPRTREASKRPPMDKMVSFWIDDDLFGFALVRAGKGGTISSYLRDLINADRELAAECLCNDGQEDNNL